MNACIEYSTLIRLVAGELASARREQALEHLAGCADCRQRHEELQATWRTLGHWQPTAPGKDLWTAIAAQAGRRPAAMPWARLAAAVVLAAGLGSAAAFLAPPRVTPPSHAANVSDLQFTDALGLDALGEPPSSLANLFAEPDDSEGEARS